MDSITARGNVVHEQARDIDGIEGPGAATVLASHLDLTFLCAGSSTLIRAEHFEHVLNPLFGAAASEACRFGFEYPYIVFREKLAKQVYAHASSDIVWAKRCGKQAEPAPVILERLGLPGQVNEVLKSKLK